jgi:RimJ/RimL family protein N-acetyltransferase
LISNDAVAATLQPIGEPVTLAQPPPQPSRVTLTGKAVTIEPLKVDHAKDLYELVEGQSNAQLFTYLGDEPYASLAAFQEAVSKKSASEDPLFFAFIDHASARPVGWAALMRIDSTHRVVEVGNILFSPALKQTRAATEAMYLFARYVFEELGYRRYEWKCDNLNKPSKRAAIRFGFSFEGIFRKHMVVKGRSRDTCWFGMTADDWQHGGVKHGYEIWLEDGNFDEQGRQKTRLEECRPSLPRQKGPVELEI